MPKKETQDLSHQTENNDSEQTGIDNPGELYPDGANSNDVNHDTDSTDYPNTNLIDNPDVVTPEARLTEKLYLHNFSLTL